MYLQHRIEDEEAANELSKQLTHILNDARESARLASSLAPSIRNRVAGFHDGVQIQQSIHAYAYGALCGPLLCVLDAQDSAHDEGNTIKNRNEDNQIHEGHDTLETWLEAIFHSSEKAYVLPKSENASRPASATSNRAPSIR